MRGNQQASTARLFRVARGRDKVTRIAEYRQRRQSARERKLEMIRWIAGQERERQAREIARTRQLNRWRWL